MATILIAGGTGLIGSKLSAMLLEKGYKVIILSRRPGKEPDGGHSILNEGSGASPDLQFSYWNPIQQEIDKSVIGKVDAIINLAGAGIADKRWSGKRKKEIVGSRVLAAKLLVKALTEFPNHVASVVNISAIGWYGPDSKRASEHEAFTETDPPDSAFLGDACRQWEESIAPVHSLGKRLVILRTGIVLSNEGGAFVEFKKPLRFGIAAIMGRGMQIMSWIHLDDLCRLFIYSLGNKQVSGIYNATAPKPIDNASFTLALARKLRQDHFIPVHIPSFILKLVLGELSIEVMKSAKVSSEKIKTAGFQFVYPSVEAALEDLCK